MLQQSQIPAVACQHINLSIIVLTNQGGAIYKLLTRLVRLLVIQTARGFKSNEILVCTEL